jgi:hypothetical protein
MKHPIVHTLQKYVLNPPIKLALALGLPLPGCVARNERTVNREATPHARGRWTYRKRVLASGRAWHEGRIRP